MTKISIDEVHEILLAIAKEFHRICEDNGITYYMLGGTMLGAVRHKGFIPWDDDMDFGVARKDFQRLEELFNNCKNSPYRLRTLYNSKTILNEPSKLEDTRTLIVELERANIEEEIGINIDIFPLDITNGNKSFFSKNNLVHIIGLINTYRYGNLKVLNFWRKVLAICFKIIFYPFDKYSLLSFARKHLIPNEGEFISNLYGYWGVKETIPRKVMGHPVKYQFEDTYFYGVENYDEYLKSLYNEYMKIPSRDNLHIHLDNAFKK
jgi:lipopolysaccharide cholinephosphotransferase